MSRDLLGPSLLNGKVDMIAAMVTVRPELEAIAAFSEPTAWAMAFEAWASARKSACSLCCRMVPSSRPRDFGTMKIGAVAVPTSTGLRAADYAYALAESRARVLIVDGSVWAEVAPALARQAQHHT